MRHGPHPRLAVGIQSAHYVGKSATPVNCHHLAFTQDTVDWQIWVEAGDEPVLRKMLVTYKTLPDSPRYEATIVSWESTPNPDGAFAVQLPPNAKKIDVKTPAQRAVERQR